MRLALLSLTGVNPLAGGRTVGRGAGGVTGFAGGIAPDGVGTIGAGGVIGAAGATGFAGEGGRGVVVGTGLIGGYGAPPVQVATAACTQIWFNRIIKTSEQSYVQNSN